MESISNQPVNLQQQQQQHSHTPQQQQHHQQQPQQQQQGTRPSQFHVASGQMIQTSPNVKRQTRKNRVNFTPEQLEVLEKAFDGNPYPDAVKREDIAKQADLPETRVQVNLGKLNGDLNLPNKTTQYSKKNLPADVKSQHYCLKSITIMSTLIKLPKIITGISAKTGRCCPSSNTLLWHAPETSFIG